jgi:hypothetical protein
MKQKNPWLWKTLVLTGKVGPKDVPSESVEEPVPEPVPAKRGRLKKKAGIDD